MKITNANTADCTISTADDMNYGWGAFKRGAANSKRARERGGKKIEVPDTSQKKKKKHRFMGDTRLEPICESAEICIPPNSTFHQ